MSDSTLVRQVILFHHLDELRRKDPDLDKFFNSFRLKTYHPSLFRLGNNLKTVHPEPSLDLKSICQSLESSLSNELIEIGKYVCDKEAPDAESLKTEVDLFLSEVRAIDNLDRESNSLRVQTAKAAEDYFKFTKKHTEDFKINFKLAHDHSTANLLYAKAYAICLKKRLRDTEKAVDKFGKASIISELRRKRDSLESQNKILKQELGEKQERLKQYDEMDPVLMKKYHSLKEELNYRIWACKQADQGSNSSSGSIEFS